MKSTYIKLLGLIFIFTAFAFSYMNYSSDEPIDNNLEYEVNTVYPALSLTKEQVKTAQVIADLNKMYKPSWIREHLSVEIFGIVDDKLQKAIGTNDELTEEQKKLMNSVDFGSEIEVKVSYIPENTLKDNEPKEINFAFIVNPEIEATFQGGKEGLNQYLKEKAISKIPIDCFKGYDLAILKFTIDKKGKVVNPHIVESSKNEKVDELLLNTVRHMPNWKPAQYINGPKVDEELILTIGNHQNCFIHTFNIRRD